MVPTCTLRIAANMIDTYNMLVMDILDIHAQFMPPNHSDNMFRHHLLS